MYKHIQQELSTSIMLASVLPIMSFLPLYGQKNEFDFKIKVVLGIWEYLIFDNFIFYKSGPRVPSITHTSK